jgi:hypothetical protein
MRPAVGRPRGMLQAQGAAQEAAQQRRALRRRARARPAAPRPPRPARPDPTRQRATPPTGCSYARREGVPRWHATRSGRLRAPLSRFGWAVCKPVVADVFGVRGMAGAAAAWAEGAAPAAPVRAATPRAALRPRHRRPTRRTLPSTHAPPPSRHGRPLAQASGGRTLRPGPRARRPDLPGVADCGTLRALQPRPGQPEPACGPPATPHGPGRTRQEQRAVRVPRAGGARGCGAGAPPAARPHRGAHLLAAAAAPRARGRPRPAPGPRRNQHCTDSD